MIKKSLRDQHIFLSLSSILNQEGKPQQTGFTLECKNHRNTSTGEWEKNPDDPEKLTAITALKLLHDTIIMNANVAPG